MLALPFLLLPLGFLVDPWLRAGRVGSDVTATVSSSVGMTQMIWPP